MDILIVVVSVFLSAAAYLFPMVERCRVVPAHSAAALRLLRRRFQGRIERRPSDCRWHDDAARLYIDILSQTKDDGRPRGTTFPSADSAWGGAFGARLRIVLLATAFAPALAS
jgi:hypothetical protein